MRQAHLTAVRSIEFREGADPRPASGEVLVRIRAALTCGTDLKTYRRGHPKLGYGPFGHEASGDVVAVGQGVSAFAPGDAVMWVQTAPCGTCERCREGRENLCERLFESMALGAYGDRLMLPARVVARNLYRKPPSLSYIEAAFLEPLSCIVHGWNVLARTDASAPIPRDIAIVGAGTIGLLHLAYAVRSGVSATVVARGAERKALAMQMGAHRVIDADDGDTLTDARCSFAAAIECAGTIDAWQLACALVRPGGRALLFSGLPSGSRAPVDAAGVHYAEKTLAGAFHFTPSDVAQAYELLCSSTVQLRPLVTDVVRLDRLPEIFELLDRRIGHKYALIPDGEPARWI
jgi:L-iditol 2-dehydrogenase